MAMHIKNIKVILTEKDILSIIEENLKVPELKIEKIHIGDFIEVQGYYFKRIRLNFKAFLRIGNVKDNMLKLKIFRIKLGIFPIWMGFINFAFGNILKSLSNMGITFEKKTILIDFTSLCTQMPFVNFKLESINTVRGNLEVEIEDLMYEQSKQALSLSELKQTLQSECEEEHKEGQTKTQDAYSKIRSQIQEKIREIHGEIWGRFSKNLTKISVKAPGKFPGQFSKISTDHKENTEESQESWGQFSKSFTKQSDNINNNIYEYIMLVPDIIALLYRLMKDERIKLKTKTLICAALAYLVLPTDIILDAIPVLGKVDDFGIGFLILDKIIEDVPHHIIMQHWEGKDDIILKAKEMKDVLFNIIGRKNAINLLGSVLLGIKRTKRRKY
jgi:uncharacterized membrane protein YkvA (DUF1232 family)